MNSDFAEGLVGLAAGTALMWLAFRLTWTLTWLIRPARSKFFQRLYVVTIWAVGLAAIVTGVALAIWGGSML